MVGRHGDGWRVRVAAAAQDGRANAELVRLVAGLVGVSASAVGIVHGAGSRDKLIEIRGLSQPDAEAALDAAAG
jgi:uncharacterized protein YggU (UPF0235/DUF167 family)